MLFSCGEESPIAERYSFEFEWSELYAFEFFDGVSEVCHHSSYLSISTFAEFHKEMGAFTITLHEFEADGSGAVCMAASAIVEEDSFFELSDAFFVE